MDWFTLDEKKPPKNKDLLLLCVDNTKNRKSSHSKNSYKYMVGRYSAGLEWWDLPYPAMTPVIWAEIDTHSAMQAVEELKLAREKLKI